MSDNAFPDDFLWGVASAGHQIEGNNVDSDTWFLENVSPTIFQARSGQAADGWNRWEEDLDLIKGLGLNAYRFSVEWARIEPVEDAFSEEALDHYEAIVDGCIARGIAPVVTFNHFTSPHWFAKQAAWLNPGSAKLFARYCGRVMDRFGDRIAIAVTFNEPDLPEMLSWMDLPPFVAELERATLASASKGAGVERYRASNVMLHEDFAGMRAGMTAAHRAAKAAIKERCPELRVGLTLAIIDDVAVAGGEEIRDRKRAEVYQHWLELARDDDFVGVQNYERAIYGPDGEVHPSADTIVNEQGTAVEPDSLRGAVEYAYSVAKVPIIVTEHGISTADDSVRQAFIEPSLIGLEKAMERGVPVLGYFHWTLMDNFEWIFGYSRQLGLHSVDRTTFERAPKPSALVLAKAVQTRKR
jgi:beta-glucosidase